MDNDLALSIVVPYYKENAKELLPLLASINNQVGIDFSKIEVLLVNDGNLDGNQIVEIEEMLRLFDNVYANAQLIKQPDNGGPGVARQAGITYANGDYILFCDADDILHNVAVIGAFLQEIDANYPDIITSLWLEELVIDGRYIYINHEDEATWMHGKVFRRNFLVDNNIQFHDDLRVHEDSYFLALAFDATENKRKLMFTSYVWKYVPTSITRRNDASYTYDSIPEFIRAIDLSFQELEKRNSQSLVYKTVQFAMYHYFILHQGHWLQPENAEYLKAAEKAFKRMIRKYIKYYKMAAPEVVNQIYNDERTKHFNGQIEFETLSMWFRRIGVS